MLLGLKLDAYDLLSPFTLHSMSRLLFGDWRNEIEVIPMLVNGLVLQGSIIQSPRDSLNLVFALDAGAELVCALLLDNIGRDMPFSVLGASWKETGDRQRYGIRDAFHVNGEGCKLLLIYDVVSRSRLK